MSVPKRFKFKTIKRKAKIRINILKLAVRYSVPYIDELYTVEDYIY